MSLHGVPTNGLVLLQWGFGENCLVGEIKTGREFWENFDQGPFELDPLGMEFWSMWEPSVHDYNKVVSH